MDREASTLRRLRTSGVGGTELVDIHYPAAERMVLVMDQLHIHRTASLDAAFPAADRPHSYPSLLPTTRHLTS